MRVINMSVFQVVKKSLIILTIILILNSLFTSCYLAATYPDFNNNLADWLALVKDISIDSLSIYLINRNNLIGDLLAFYQDFSPLQFEYQLGGYYGIKIFLSSPQSMFTDIVNALAVVFIIIHVIFIVYKPKFQIRKSEFEQPLQKQTFIAKHKLDIGLFGVLTTLVVFYWGLWAVLRYD